MLFLSTWTFSAWGVCGSKGWIYWEEITLFSLFPTLTFHKFVPEHWSHKAVLYCREDTLSIYHSRTLRLLVDGRGWGYDPGEVKKKYVLFFWPQENMGRQRERERHRCSDFLHYKFWQRKTLISHCPLKIQEKSFLRYHLVCDHISLAANPRYKHMHIWLINMR